MRFIVALSLCVSLMAACGPSDTETPADSPADNAAPDTTEAPAHPESTDAPPDTAAAVYEAKGTVEAILPDRSFLRIAHDRISGHMDAMVMPFAVEDTTLITDIQAGDRVAFTFDESGNVAQIVAIEPIDE